MLDKPLVLTMGVFSLLLVSCLVTNANADWTEQFLYRTASNGMPYRLFLPPDHEGMNHLPVVLFLHGRGGEGTDNRTHIYNGSAGKLSWMEQPVIIIAPQSGSIAKGFTDEAEVRRAYQVLEEVRARYSIDPTRIYVTGLSRGGRGTWCMIWLYPDVFAAAVPICGWGDHFWADQQQPNQDSQWAPKLVGIPIWAFHGTDDEVVPASNSQYMIDQINQAIAASESSSQLTKPKLTLLPGVGHNSWDPAYRDPQLNQWLFAQRLERKHRH